MAKKTWTLDLNGAATGSGTITPAIGGPVTIGYLEFQAGLQNAINSVASGYVVTGSGPFTIEQPENYGDFVVTVEQGTLDQVPILTLTQDWSPTVNVSVDNSAISEPGDVAVVAFAIPATHSAAVTIAFSMGGTANNPADYTKSANSPVEIASGSSTNTMSIVVVDDATFEGDETITVTLGSITGGEAGTSSSVSITLASDDIGSGGAKNMLLMGVG